MDISFSLLLFQLLPIFIFLPIVHAKGFIARKEITLLAASYVNAQWSLSKPLRIPNSLADGAGMC